jgi:oligopeptide transport system permease protein
MTALRPPPRVLPGRAAAGAAVVLGALVLGCVLVPELSRYRYDRTDLELGATPPSAAHWMGTDTLGRDLMARVFSGGRISLAVGALAMLASVAVGLFWGTLAGYLGGRKGGLMMRVVDALDTLPLFVVAALFMVFFGGEGALVARAVRAALALLGAAPDEARLGPLFQLAGVLAALGSLSWTMTARIVRARVLALRAQPFVEGARALGAGRASIVFRHLLPNALGPAIVQATLTMYDVMISEAFLSFVGLGTQEPLSSLGLVVASGVETMDLHPWLAASPGLLLVVTLVCVSVLGDALRDALDPRRPGDRARR